MGKFVDSSRTSTLRMLLTRAMTWVFAALCARTPGAAQPNINFTIPDAMPDALADRYPLP